ncbi:MAG: hypothetical protein EU536_00465 [Promethearchaeota archaeon]|nr:MAG: hypothetical protein EU536_00465 [Candidatus Lokiarchaeota archaeon]
MTKWRRSMPEKDGDSIDLLLKNAKIFFNGEVVEGGIAISQGQILKVGKVSHLPPCDTILDIQGNLIIPGVIDIHSHLRDLDLQYKEDFYSGTCAAANGGITTVIDMPNTQPATISSQLLKQKIDTAQKKVVINVGFYAGIPNSLTEIEDLVKKGIFGFKIYLANKLSDFDMYDPDSLHQLLLEIKKNDCPLLVHAERKLDIHERIADLNSSELSAQDLYLMNHSPEVEKSAISYILRLNQRVGALLHICHVSTLQGVELIREEKNRSVWITAEVTPHHLFLSKEVLKKFNGFAKMLPPLRSPIDLEALWAGVNDRTIDCIATDHAPHLLSEKECTFASAANGIPGFETLVPLLFTALNQDQITLSRLIEVLSEFPAKFLHLSKKGKIAPGFDADLCVIDPKRTGIITPENFFSKAKFSPFRGRKVKGRPVMTIVKGKIVMRDNEILVNEGTGNILLRE